LLMAEGDKAKAEDDRAQELEMIKLSEILDKYRFHLRNFLKSVFDKHGDIKIKINFLFQEAEMITLLLADGSRETYTAPIDIKNLV